MPVTGLASDLDVRIRLIWGTDDDPSKYPKLPEVSAQVAEPLKKIFKWKHYLKVNDVPVSVPDGKTVRKELSDKCAVELKTQGKAMLEVKFYGEGKLLKTMRHDMPPGECLIVGGDDKNQTAWFVVITAKK